jgi:sugar lactone lactonase YvrE
MLSRRCGVLAILHWYLFALLAILPSISFGQTLSLVHNSTRYAGTGSAGFSGDYGAATTVTLNAPSYIAFDSNGNQYLSDTLNNCVRKIDTAGNITTVAGLAVSGQPDTCNSSSNNSPAASEGLYQPTGLAIDSSNRLYIADSMHNCIRALAPGSTGVASLTTVAGTCTSSPNASVTPAPNGLAIDVNNNLYIALQDLTNSVNQVVRHTGTDAATSVCYLAGQASANITVPCPGITNGVKLSGPSGLAIDISNNLYIADTGNNCVREVAGLTTQRTAVGQCLNDGTGTPETTLGSPYGLAISPTQALLITESHPDNVVRYIPGTAALTLTAGLPNGVAGPYLMSQDGESALNAPLNSPRGITFDSSAHIFLADSLNNIARELSDNMQFSNTPVGSQSATQSITFVINQLVNLSVTAGADYIVSSTTCTGNLTPAAPGSAPNTCQIFARFAPTLPGLRRSALRLTDAISNTSVFQGLKGTGTGALSLFAPGSINTIANVFAKPSAIATDAAGNAFILEAGQSSNADLRVLAPGASSAQTIIPAGYGLDTPTAIVADAAGNWFVADASHNSIARFGADGSINTNYITGLSTPTAIAADRFGNLFVAQARTHNVIEVYTTGARRTIAGSGATSNADGVLATASIFIAPSALTTDLNGKLYIADLGTHRVYVIDQSGIIHIVAGNGSMTTTIPGQATGTALTAPVSLAADAAGDLYIADQGASLIYVVYAAAASGNNIAIALDGSGPNGVLPQPTTGPLAIALDANGNLFAANATTNSVIELTHTNPALNFGHVNAGTTSTALLQSLSNIGTDSLEITSPFSTSDTHFAVDSNTTTCGTTILSGSVCSLGFTFTPTANATYTATSTLASNSYNTPQSIQLNGSGNQLAQLTVTLPAETEVYGQQFSAPVSFGGATTAPTGTITFATAGETLCSLTGNLGTATTCHTPTTGLNVGTYTVAFNYSGDTNYQPAAGTVVLTVTKAPLAIGVSDASRIYGTPNPIFTGSVTGILNDDKIAIDYSTTATAASSAGRYIITATVSGPAAANYQPTIQPATLTISATETTTTISTSNPAPTTAGSIIFTAYVSAANGKPTGTVKFYDGATLLGSGTLNAIGTTTFITPALTVGSHTISAAFQPTTNFSTSGASLVESVTTAIPTTPTFTLTSTTPTQYIHAGGSTSFPITLTGSGGFSGNVAMACTGLPANATCAFSNATPRIPIGSSVTVTMTITSTATTAKLQGHSPFRPADLAPLTAATIFPMELTSLTVCCAGFRRRTVERRRRVRIFAAGLFTVTLLILTGCGTVTTGVRDYTIHVTGTSVSFPTQVQTATTVVLTVGQQ